MTLSKFVEYIKQAWANRPSATTPISAERLLHMESGIKANNEAIRELAAAVVSAIVNDPNKIASMAALYAVNQAVTELNSNSVKNNRYVENRTNIGSVALIKGDDTAYHMHLYNDEAAWFAEFALSTKAPVIESDVTKLSIANVQRISSYNGILYITLADGDVYEIEMTKQ